jgi:hypothetical protein
MIYVRNCGFGFLFGQLKTKTNYSNLLVVNKMEPSSIPNVTNRAINNVELSQGWLENGECPEGTIPIRRAREDEYDVHRAPPPVAHRKNPNISLDYDYNRGHEVYHIIKQLLFSVVFFS